MRTSAFAKVHAIALVAGIAVLGGCAGSGVALKDRPATGGYAWPGPPSEPRLVFVTEFTGAEDLGIQNRFLARLRVFVSGRRQERLVRPTAIVEGAPDRYFVADPGVRGVHLFDIDRGRYRLIRAEGGEPLPSPVGLARGPAGEVYVTDSRLASLFVIEPGDDEARRLPLEGLIAQPTGVAVDAPSGHIYLVDTGSHEVKIFSREGALLGKIGGRGTAPGQFNFPTMVWMRAGELHVSDSLNFRVQVFDKKGQFIREFGGPGDRAGYQPQSKGIATDSHGQVYVVDSILHAVQIFDASGAFLYRLGHRGEAVGEFWLPAGVYIDGSDTIFVADAYNGRIQVFRYVGGGAQ